MEAMQRAMNRLQQQGWIKIADGKVCKAQLFEFYKENICEL